MGPGARAKPRIFAHNGADGGQAATGIETLFDLKWGTTPSARWNPEIGCIASAPTMQAQDQREVTGKDEQLVYARLYPLPHRNVMADTRASRRY